MSVQSRFQFVSVVCLVFAVILVGRALSVQLGRNDRFETLARKQFRSKVLIRPRRGLVFDRNGEALAVNSDIQSLAANPSQFKGRTQEMKGIARRLAQALKLPEKAVQKKLSGSKEFAWMKRHLGETETQALRSLRILDDRGSLVDGLWLVKEAKRVYPHHELAAHILGTVDLDTQGVEGIELSKNAHLEGKSASVPAVRDALGRAAFFDADTAREMKEGETVKLTIDAPLQFGVEEELRAALKKHSAKGGSVIVMNYETGEILAMANLPTFDPNTKEVRAERRRNRAITDGYEPGSTIKPLLVATALSNGWHLSDRLFGEYGALKLQGKTITEAEAHEKFEWLSLKEMVAHSSNVVSAKLALKLGSDKVAKGYRRLGLGEKSGVDFPGEISGKVGASSNWKPIELATIGFGHGLLVTPLQMLRAYAAIANGGTLVKPCLIMPEKGSCGTEVRVMETWVAKSVEESLAAVVQPNRSGAKAAVPGFEVVGKTGTSQVIDPKTGRYSQSRYVASFIGYGRGLPVPLVVYTSVDEPKGVYYGAETAAPLFRRVFEVAVSRFSLGQQSVAQKASSDPKRELKDQLKASLAKVVVEEERKLQWIDREEDGTAAWKMANLEGLTLREALRVLEGRDFQVEVKGHGPVVRKQVPAAHAVIPEKSSIRLQLGEL